MGSLAAAAFAAGLLGGVHCAGMCGGIVGSLSAAARGSVPARQLAFNAGRILSYAFAGALAGGLGSLAQLAGPVLVARTALFIVANILMVLLGLYVAGWARGLLRLEAAGGRIWRHIEPLARRAYPIDSAPKSFAAGLVWGWVPCGLVYSMLALALASGSIAGGALVMAAFGAGTLPNLFAVGFAAQRVLQWRRAPWLRRAAGTLLIALAIVGFARAPGLAEAIRAGWHCIA
jgi:sulfite exporter TauE/SafE